MKEAMVSALFHFDRPTLVIYASIICAGELEGGKADEALGYCDKALKLAATVKDIGYPFEAYGAKGRALVQLGRLSEAQQILEAALVKTKQLDMRLEESQTLILLGKESEAAGNLPQAIRYFEQAGELSRANGFEHSIAWSMFEAAEAYRSAGDLQKAEDRETQAMRAMARVGDRYHLPIHLALLADLKAKRGEFAEADQLYDRAADVVDGMLVGSPNDQVESLIANMGDVYVGHFGLAAMQLRNTRKAYEILEAARGRSIANTLRDPPTKDVPSDAIGTNAKRQVNQIQLALLRETDPDARSKLLDRLFEAEQILTPVGRPRTELQEAARHPHPVDLARLQSSLHPDEVVLEYVLAEPQSFCLRITRGTAAVSALPAGRRQIEQLVDSYLGDVRSKKPAIETGEKLYALLLQPIHSRESDSSLIIIPDGKLHVLPFDSLRDGRGRYVLESHIVTYAPSATVLYLLRRTQRDHPTTARLLAVGGVPYERAPSILPVKVTGNTPGQASASGDFLGPAGLRLSNLPGTQEEVINSAELLGGQHTLLLGKDATEAAFKSLRLADFSVIHLAVHGIASTQFPDRAALVLGRAPSSGEDGLLQVREIRDLPLDADLVTLSACDTGEGKLLGEEGIASLERAFLLAGAKTVIASLWTAEDACTTWLMKRLYWHLADGEDKGSALRQAKLDLLKEFGEEAVPFYWAGFTLVGEGSTAISQPACIPETRLAVKNTSYTNKSRTSAKWKVSAPTR